METPERAERPEHVFVFRLYGGKGEIATFTTSVPIWEPGDLVTLRDGRLFKISTIAPVAGGDIDGIFEVEQVEQVE